MNSLSIFQAADVTDKPVAIVAIAREAVEQAIAALKSDEEMATAFHIEISALHAALEQPQVEQRPVANNWSVFNSGAEVASGLSLEDAVDYLNYRDRLGRDWCAVCVIDKGNPPIFVNPQPKREPLTDEQIWELYCDWHGEPDGCYGFARAIEAAHNIK